MTHGGELNIFFHNSTKYVAMGYSTSDSLSYSNEVTKISSKDHGLHPESETSGSSWSFSGSALFTTANANTLLGMAATGEPYTFVFAQTAEHDHFRDGLKSVTDISTNVSWTVGSSFVRYGSGIVSSVSVTAADQDTATVDFEITGSGRLLDTAPATPQSYS